MNSIEIFENYYDLIISIIYLGNIYEEFDEYSKCENNYYEALELTE